MSRRQCHVGYRNGLALVVALLIASGSVAIAITSYEFSTPVFGLATASDDSLLAADAGSGIVELRKGVGSLVAELPGVTDVAPIGRGDMFATRGATAQEEPGGALFRVSRGTTHLIADLFAFEEAANPHSAAIDSNPFDVEVLAGGHALVADAAGNDLLIVGPDGRVDWIAVFPDELVSTSNIKSLAGCATPPPGFEFICFLPAMMPAQAVATSAAIGPDGAYYVGELKGFPGPTDESRVWRVEPGTRHADCAVSPACSVVADGFTSIVDLEFGPDGTLYVVELDEASWLVAEFPFAGLGGTVNACDTDTWTCSVVSTGLPLPIAATTTRDGTVHVAINALVPGAAEVITVP